MRRWVCSSYHTDIWYPILMLSIFVNSCLSKHAEIQSVHRQISLEIYLLRREVSSQIYSLSISIEYQEENTFDVWITKIKNLMFYFEQVEMVSEVHFSNRYICTCYCLKPFSTILLKKKKNNCWHWSTLIYIRMKLIRNKDLGHIPVGDSEQAAECQHTCTWQNG